MNFKVLRFYSKKASHLKGGKSIGEIVGHHTVVTFSRQDNEKVGVGVSVPCLFLSPLV